MVVCPLCSEPVFPAARLACLCGSLGKDETRNRWTFFRRGCHGFLCLDDDGFRLVRIEAEYEDDEVKDPDQIVDRYLMEAKTAEVLLS